MGNKNNIPGNPVIIIAIAMVAFGGLPAIVGLVYDRVRGPTAVLPPDQKQVHQKIFGALVLFFLAPMFLSIAAKNLGPETALLMDYKEIVTIAIVVAIIELQLRQNGIFITSNDFWRQQLSKTLKNQSKSGVLSAFLPNLEQILKGLEPSAKPSPQSQKKVYSHPQSSASTQSTYSSPINVDRSSDANRVRIIIIICLIAAAAFAYFWAEERGYLDDPEKFIETYINPTPEPAEKGVRRTPTQHLSTPLSE